MLTESWSALVKLAGYVWFFFNASKFYNTFTKEMMITSWKNLWIFEHVTCLDSVLLFFFVPSCGDVYHDFLRSTLEYHVNTMVYEYIYLFVNSFIVFILFDFNLVTWHNCFHAIIIMIPPQHCIKWQSLILSRFCNDFQKRDCVLSRCWCS